MTETTEPTVIPDTLLARPLVIKPRRTGYVHRPLLIVHNGVGHTEHDGPVHNLPVFAAAMDSHVWVTLDPAWLLDHLTYHFEYHPEWTYQLSESGTDQVSRTKLTRFGFSRTSDQRAGQRHFAMHLCWMPFDMVADPSFIDATVEGLMTFAADVRAWLLANDLPIPSSLSGIGSSLLRDTRFYPVARGRVPTATNERLRPFLPGVHQELRTQPNKRAKAAIALDQRGAYHQIAQDVPVPDATTLYARGHFNDVENAPIWLSPDDDGFTDLLTRPGIIAALVLSRPTRTHEWRIPALDYSGLRRIYLWSNEIPDVLLAGAEILGIYAAWVAETADTGLPAYGKWAAQEIRDAPPYRKHWLKQALHTTYGLLGAKPRVLRFGRRLGTGLPAKWLLGTREFFVRTAEFDHAPPLANVAQLGALQAEVRARTLRMAQNLTDNGAHVTHIHADGLHVVGALPLIDNTWRMEERTNLTYIDRVSWTSDQGNVLPGRAREHAAKEQSIKRPLSLGYRLRVNRTEHRDGIS